MPNMMSDDHLILEERFPRIAARLRHECAERQIAYDVRIARNQRGQTVAQVIYNGRERALVSQYDPLKQAETFAEALYRDVADVFVVCGLALGYYAQALLSRMTARQRLIVVEPSWAFVEQQLGAESLRSVLADDRFHLIVEEDAAHAMYAIEYNVWHNAGLRIVGGSVPVYQELFPEFTTALRISVQALSEIVVEDVRSFAQGCDEIKGNYFNEHGQMGDMTAFFARIAQKQQERELTRVEYAYLFGQMMLVHKAYGENAALGGEKDVSKGLRAEGKGFNP